MICLTRSYIRVVLQCFITWLFVMSWWICGLIVKSVNTTQTETQPCHNSPEPQDICVGRLINYHSHLHYFRVCESACLLVCSSENLQHRRWDNFILETFIFNPLFWRHQSFQMLLVFLSQGRYSNLAQGTMQVHIINPEKRRLSKHSVHTSTCIK